MKPVTRRNFLQFSAAAAAIAHLRPSGLQGAAPPEDKADIGIYVVLDPQNVDGTFKRISDLGFRSCELYTDGYGMDLAEPLQAAIKKYNMRVLALFTLGPGPTIWDFYEGQHTIGLVCREYRDARLDAMFKLSDLAKACNIPMIETHVGYIPENPQDPNYGETVEALKKVVGYCAKNRQDFLYHAGQESPTTMLRTMTDVGYDNQGVGMDTANLIMYDRGHPFYAIDVYGKYIKLVNCKDGLYPVDPRNLGREVQIGQGMVNFPTFFKKLQASGYKGPIIIEREASDGPQWEKDVRQSRDYLQSLLK
jgi:sugar phosphate isomerase/epimerase